MRAALSWSGGKDGMLALDRLLQLGADVTLVHLTDAATRCDRAHGVPDFVIEDQAAALGLPLVLDASDWAGYEEAFLDVLARVAPDAVAFGDIQLEAHRAWGERIARRAGVDAMWPLWNAPTRAVVDEVLARGFRAVVTACRPPLGASFAGRFLDATLVEDAIRRGADPAGEDGAYHTLVVGGPRFRRPLEVTAGDVVPWGPGWRVTLGLRGC